MYPDYLHHSHMKRNSSNLLNVSSQKNNKIKLNIYGEALKGAHNLKRGDISRQQPVKVRKAIKMRNRYNQVPHLTQDTTWESDKNTIKHH